jgi:hypothetical protein
MVHATVSGSVKPSGTKQLYEVWPPAPSGAATAAVSRRRLRNLSVPTIRSSKTTSSIPQGGDSSRQAHSGGIETSVSRERLPPAASAQLGCTRSSGRIGGRGSSKGRSCSAGAGPRANPNATGSGVCRTATQRDRCPTRIVTRARSPECPSSASSSSGRAGGRVRRSSPYATPSQVFGSARPVPPSRRRGMEQQAPSLRGILAAQTRSAV